MGTSTKVRPTVRSSRPRRIVGGELEDDRRPGVSGRSRLETGDARDSDLPKISTWTTPPSTPSRIVGRTAGGAQPSTGIVGPTD